MQIRSAIPWVIVLLAAVQTADGQEAEPSLTSISNQLHNKSYEAVLAASSSLLTQTPQEPRLWIAQGLALRGLRRTGESLDSFQHALQLRPGNAVALQGAAEAAFAVHDPKTKQYLEEILTKDPGNSIASAMAGSLAYEAGDCAHAVQYFGRADNVLIVNSTGSLQFSHCLILNGDAAKAVTVLTSLKERDKSEMVVFDLASSLFYSGKYKESVASLEGLQKNGADSADIWNLLGADYDKLDRVPDALEAYRKACERAPENSGYYIDLARFAMEHSSTDAAIKVLDAGIARNPKSAALFTVRGSVYSFQGDSAKAETDFVAAETVEPTSGFGHVGRSLLLSDQGKSADAERLLRAELKRNPNDSEVKYFLAETLAKMPTPSNDEEAEKLLDEVLRDRPSDPNVLLALAKTHLDRNENQPALTLLLRARSLDADSAPVLNRLLQTYRALGMKPESASCAALLRSAVDRNREAELRRNRFQIVVSTQNESRSRNERIQ